MGISLGNIVDTTYLRCSLLVGGNSSSNGTASSGACAASAAAAAAGAGAPPSSLPLSASTPEWAARCQTVDPIHTHTQSYFEFHERKTSSLTFGWKLAWVVLA